MTVTPRKRKLFLSCLASNWSWVIFLLGARWIWCCSQLGANLWNRSTRIKGNLFTELVHTRHIRKERAGWSWSGFVHRFLLTLYRFSFCVFFDLFGWNRSLLLVILSFSSFILLTFSHLISFSLSQYIGSSFYVFFSSYNVFAFQYDQTSFLSFFQFSFFSSFLSLSRYFSFFSCCISYLFFFLLLKFIFYIYL